MFTAPGPAHSRHPALGWHALRLCHRQGPRSASVSLQSPACPASVSSQSRFAANCVYARVRRLPQCHALAYPVAHRHPPRRFRSVQTRARLGKRYDMHACRQSLPDGTTVHHCGAQALLLPLEHCLSRVLGGVRGRGLNGAGSRSCHMVSPCHVVLSSRILPIGNRRRRYHHRSGCSHASDPHSPSHSHRRQGTCTANARWATALASTMLACKPHVTLPACSL